MSAIGGISAALSNTAALSQTTSQVPKTGSVASGSNTFADTLQQAISGASAAQNKADVMAQQAATGDLQDVHDYMIAATEATVSTELTLAVRNKVVEAFNQIMQMSI